MSGVWVSSSGTTKLGIYKHHDRYWGMIPYSAIPPIDPGPGPEPDTPRLYLVPFIDGIYSAQVLDGTEQLPYTSLQFICSVEDPEYDEYNIVLVDDTYIVTEIIKDEYVPDEGVLIVMSEEYET